MRGENTMEYKLISVIVPIYKVEQYLDRCIESLVNQTYKNLEIVLVDDGSPDHCPKMCDEWAEKDSRIKVIHKANGGLSDARNAGMKIAAGEYISFVDSDDWTHKDFYKVLMQVMSEQDADIVSCGIKRVYSEQDDCNIAEYSIEVFDRTQAMEAVLEEKIPVPVWCKLYKSEVIKNELFDVGKYHEDVFWTYRAYGHASSSAIINADMYYYFQRATGIMGERFSEKRLDALEAMELLCRYIEKNFPELSELALNKYMGLCMYLYQTVIREKNIKDKKALTEAILKKVKRESDRYKASAKLNIKDRFWLKLFCNFPNTACKIRNLFKIGV